MDRTVDLLRHTDSEGDMLTEEGVRVAVELGRRLTGGYDLLVSSGAQRATQTLACLLCGLGQQVDGGVLVDPGFRSAVEDRWRDAAQRARGKDLEAFREADPELVEKESALLGSVLSHLFERLPEKGRALVVGHSPTHEAAVLGICGQVTRPLTKGAGVRVVQEDGSYRIEALS
jgi:broad specificity phosphatase PhoE